MVGFSHHKERAIFGMRGLEGVAFVEFVLQTERKI